LGRCGRCGEWVYGRPHRAARTARKWKIARCSAAWGGLRGVRQSDPPHRRAADAAAVCGGEGKHSRADVGAKAHVL